MVTIKEVFYFMMKIMAINKKKGDLSGLIQ